MSLATYMMWKIALADPDEDKYYESGDIAGDITAQYMGKEYEGQEKEGYTFYKLYFPVINTGTENYDDVEVQPVHYEDFNVYYSENEFRFVDTKIVPPSQSGVVEIVIQAKDELDSIQTIYYTSFNDSHADINRHEEVIQLR